MFPKLFLLLILAGCATSPIDKENAYHGEPLSEIGENGLLVAHVTVPLDKFPHDRKTTILYFQNIKTKKDYMYGDTQGPIFMKIPPGDYVIKDLWAGGGCHSSTGLMISSFFSQLPDDVAYLRGHLERPATQSLGFKIHKGRMTDIGNLLLTCMEWDTRAKFKQEFVNYISSGKFQIYRPYTPEQYECGCKILRKRDGLAQSSMKKALKQD